MLAVAHLTGGGAGGHAAPPHQIEGGEKANAPLPWSFFWNFLERHKQRGDPLEIFNGPSLQTELDAPLNTGRIRLDLLFKGSLQPYKMSFSIKLSHYKEIYRVCLNKRPPRSKRPTK